jgi:mannitol 2-dehydrogenase
MQNRKVQSSPILTTRKSFDDLERRTSGIVHIGVGNFHRSHQESYLNDLLKADFEKYKNWCYTGIGMTMNDKAIQTKLKRNKFRYHIVSVQHDGKTSVDYVTTLMDMLLSYEQLDMCLSLMAQESVKIVSITITEYGYTLELSESDKELISIALSDDPVGDTSELHGITTFGLILAALAKRYVSGAKPFTVLSCDNINGNGDVCKRKCVDGVRDAHPDFLEWIEREGRFPNTMVDRITPALNDDDIVQLEKEHGFIDTKPVICEEYKSWIIEDTFVNDERPAWENVGVIFTHDVKPYEELKLGLLNVPHSYVAYWGLHKGYTYVHEVVRNGEIRDEIYAFMQEIISVIGTREDIDYVGYAQTVLQRFANATLKDTLKRIATDGSHKFKTQGLPILTRGLACGYPMISFAKYIALWSMHDGDQVTVNLGEMFMARVRYFCETFSR